MDLQALSAQALLRLCLESQDPAAWQEFVRRTQRLIAAVVSKTLRRHGISPQPDLVDDLVQDTYAKLVRDNSKALRQFKCDPDDPLFDAKFFGYLRTVASNVVRDYKRHKDADIHGGGHKQEDLEPVSQFLTAPNPHPDRQVRFDEILHCLSKLKDELNFQRDLNIFLLYYRVGLTAKEISQLPGINLKNVKGVESVLLRLIRFLRGQFGDEEDGNHENGDGQSGEDEK